MAKINLYDLSQDELKAKVEEWGLPAFRAKQLWEWLYTHKAATFDQMTNLPKTLRETLAAQATVGVLEPVEEIYSTDGQTVKRLFKLPDGQLIESVLMEYDDGRRTACISTQAGCAMGCVFCATGQMGFVRHLSHGEIVEQAVHFARLLEAEGERLSNIVLMGMGEPLHNYDNTLKAIRLMIDPAGLGIGQRHITLSTVGLVPAINKLAQEDLQIGLAISLHAANDKARDKMLPINKRYPVAELIASVKNYIRVTGRRVTFEWALIQGQNDNPEQGHELGELLFGMMTHVNLIPLNPTGGFNGKPSDPARVKAFQDALSIHGVTSTVRVRRGIDIQAGCGQLKADALRKSQRTSAEAVKDL